MNIESGQDAVQVARAADHWFAQQVQKGARSAFLPAGGTPVALYKLWEAERPAYLEKLKLVQIDEILTGSHKGEFRRFFETHLPHFAERIESPEREASRVDLALLGLGLNGHVGFHEPGLPASLFHACLNLNPETCQRLKLEKGTRGLTFGVAAFMRTRGILMMALGAEKQDIVSRLVESKENLPCCWLKAHADFTLLLDSAAAKKIHAHHLQKSSRNLSTA